MLQTLIIYYFGKLVFTLLFTLEVHFSFDLKVRMKVLHLLGSPGASAVRGIGYVYVHLLVNGSQETETGMFYTASVEGSAHYCSFVLMGAFNMQ